MSKHFSIKLFLVFISAYFLFTGNLVAQAPVIPKPQLVFRNDSLIITYHFNNCKADQQFRVWLDVSTVEGEKLVPKTLSGDIGDHVLCGATKKIYWNMGADSVFLDDVIYVKVLAETTTMTTVTNQKSGNGKYFFASLLFPGSGLNLKKGNSKPYWLMGIAGYAGVASTLYFNQMAKTAHTNYEQETDQAQKDDYLQNYNNNKKYMKISAVTTGTIWLANLIWTLAAPNSSPPKVSLGNKDLQIGTTVMPETYVPGLTLRYSF